MQRHTFYQILFSTTAFLLFSEIGIWLGYFAVIMPRFKGGHLSIPKTSDELSWMVALIDIGAFLSPFPVGYLMDQFGRLFCIRLAFISFICGGVLNIVATSAYHLYLATFLTGFSFGITFSTPPLYVAEIAKPNIRGSLGAIGVAMYSGGTAIMMTFGPYISSEHLSWVLLICPLAGFLLTFFMVESPYYYVIKNKEACAAEALTQVRSDMKTKEKDLELESIRRRVVEIVEDKGNFFELISQKGNMRAFLIVLVLGAARGAGGFVSVTTLASLTLPTDSYWKPEVSMMIFAWLNVVSSFLGITLVDRFGRKPLLIVSLLGLALITAVSAVFYYFFVETNVDVSRFTFVPHVGVILVGIFFQVGVGLVPQIQRGELLSENIKGPVTAIAVMVQSFMIFMNNKLYFMVEQSIGVYFMYVLFTGFNLVCTIFVVVYVFETKGKTFAEIQELLGR